MGFLHAMKTHLLASPKFYVLQEAFADVRRTGEKAPHQARGRDACEKDISESKIAVMAKFLRAGGTTQ